MSNDVVKISKFLSLVLRHQPATIGLKLDGAGWVGVDELLAACNKNGRRITAKQLDFVVENNDKKRFAFNEDKTRIRANQGHSVKVELEYQPTIPPPILYHGTAIRYLNSIFEQGLVKGNRHHVHLSADKKTALVVGQRQGKAVILIVRSEKMHDDGSQFFISANGVWLTDHVPAKYLEQE
jgi:putative RNA 2'-phosphotransferase